MSSAKTIFFYENEFTQHNEFHDNCSIRPVTYPDIQPSNSCIHINCEMFKCSV